MVKVAPIEQRKADHLKINLESDVFSGLANGLASYHFIHEALPELNLEAVDTSLSLFGKKLNAPILISSMTGGTEKAKIINKRLANAAQIIGVAMGVGSQRAAIENNDLAESYSIARAVAPNILLFANLGAIQLNYGYNIDQCRRAVDMIQADALILHLNPLQESLQIDGNTNFAGLAKKIELICRKMEVPVIVKEVGWGISERTARLLSECGVSVIDVAGSGGTSWSQVEMHRASNEAYRQLAATFNKWGITTADSIQNAKKVAPQTTIFASGGIQNGLDIAKCIALGATLGGIARQLLIAASKSEETVINILKLIQRQIQITMFAAGVGEINKLKNLKMEKS
jgi:isopentenyl-diphosphate Delta-isomerase